MSTIVEEDREDDFEPDVRSDDIDYWGIEARWQLNRHFQLGVGFQGYDRDSDVEEFNYSRDLWLISLEGSL